MGRLLTVVAAGVLVAAISITSWGVARGGPNGTQIHTASATHPKPVLANPPDHLTAAGAAIDDYLAVENYLAIVHYHELVEAERLRVERANAARAAGGSGAQRPGVTLGECTGFVIPDYIIMRESGGNPSAYNPSGAYGCAQTLLSHYFGGVCNGLNPYDIQGQRDCTQILYDRGGLAPWAATA